MSIGGWSVSPLHTGARTQRYSCWALAFLSFFPPHPSIRYYEKKAFHISFDDLYDKDLGFLAGISYGKIQFIN